MLRVHWQVPFEYVCVSPLDYVLLVLDVLSFAYTDT